MHLKASSMVESSPTLLGACYPTLDGITVNLYPLLTKKISKNELISVSIIDCVMWVHQSIRRIKAIKSLKSA